jgi:hypothetical protein
VELIEPEAVAHAAVELIEDDARAGEVVIL